MCDLLRKKIIYRYIIGDMDGIVGKINQHKNTFNYNYLDNLPDTQDIISKNLLEKLDDLPIAKYRGSIGIIYTSSYKNNTIAIKVVSKETNKKILSETVALNLIGSLKSNYLNSVNDMVETLEKETNMEFEYKNCKNIHKYLDNNIYGVEFLKPIDELCNKNEFVYCFEEAIPIIEIKTKLSKNKINDICKRFVLFHIDTIHNKNILFGDINIGNILYNINTDKIIVIDYGCVVSLNTQQKQFKTRLHLSQRSYESLSTDIKEWKGSDKFTDMLYKQGRPFFDMSGLKYDFSKTKLSISMFDTSLLKLDLPTNSMLIIRSFSQLSQFLKLMEIIDNYAMEIYEIVDLNIKTY